MATTAETTIRKSTFRHTAKKMTEKIEMVEMVEMGKKVEQGEKEEMGEKAEA